MATLYPRLNAQENANVPLLDKPQPPPPQQQQPQAAYHVPIYAVASNVNSNSHNVEIAQPPVKARVGNWLNTTTPWKRNCCRLWFCLFFWGFIVAIIVLGLIVQCLSGTWNATSVFEIDAAAVNTLVINVDYGDVFLGVSPTPTSAGEPQFVGIENRIYSIFRSDAEKYQSSFVVDGTTATLDMLMFEKDSANSGLGNLGTCVRPQINVIFPYGPAMSAFTIQVNAEWGSQIRFVSHPDLLFGSVAIHSKSAKSALYIDNVSATTLRVDTENRVIKARHTAATTASFETTNMKIHVENHTVLNAGQAASLTITTQNSKIEAKGVAYEVPASPTATSVQLNTKNGKAALHLTPAGSYTGAFSLKTTNGEAKIKTDTSMVVFATDKKEEKVGTYPGAGVGVNDIFVNTDNSNINFSN